MGRRLTLDECCMTETYLCKVKQNLIYTLHVLFSFPTNRSHGPLSPNNSRAWDLIVLKYRTRNIIAWTDRIFSRKTSFLFLCSDNFFVFHCLVACFLSWELNRTQWAYRTQRTSASSYHLFLHFSTLLSRRRPRANLAFASRRLLISAKAPSRRHLCSPVTWYSAGSKRVFAGRTI